MYKNPCIRIYAIKYSYWTLQLNKLTGADRQDVSNKINTQSVLYTVQ